MNSLIVKIFVFLTEFLSGIIIGIIFLSGLLLMTKSFWAGLVLAVGGTILVVAIFGFAAIFIEIHKNLSEVRDALLNKEP